MQFLNNLLDQNEEDRSTMEIILWWEKRRFLYNGIVFLAGITSLIIILLASYFHENVTHEPADFEFLGGFIFAFMCNVGYTLGWITEIFKKPSTSYEPKMFRFGLYFTLICIALPSIIWIGVCVVDVVKLVC
jgi:uncharacterized membrane protein YhdT